MARDRYLGTVVFNYRIIQKLGEGGFGAVYLAEHVDLGRRAACKILHAEFARRQDLVERFVREAKAACAVGHRAIIDIQNSGWLESGEPFYLMEYFPGQSLAEHLYHFGPIPLGSIPVLFQPVAHALAAAHAKGVVHRDLKPANIMLRMEDGQIAEVKLLDFGVAKLMGDAASSNTGTGIGMGTPKYMAPEQARDAKHADHRADIYGFAATLFTALTGQPPFPHDNLVELMLAMHSQPPPPLRRFLPHAPAALEEVVAQCLAVHPEHRPATMQDAWARILAALTGSRSASGAGAHMAQARPATYPQGAASIAEQTTLGSAGTELHAMTARRGPRWIWIATGAALVALASAGLLMAGRSTPDAETPGHAAAVSGQTDEPAAEPGAVPVNNTASAARSSNPSQEAATAPPSDLDEPRAERASDPEPSSSAAAPAVDCSEQSFTALDGRKLGEVERAAALERLEACSARGAISKTFRDQVRAQLAARQEDRGRKPQAGLDCALAGFERISRAASPTSEAVQTALTRLKQCRTKGKIDEAAYQRVQKALIAKL